MTPLTPYSPSLEAKIATIKGKLDTLEMEIQQIGMPAGQDLLKRLEMLKIEARALTRNFEEFHQMKEPDEERMEKIEALLKHIEDEELSVGNDAEFLTQAAPSSMTVAVEAAARMVNLYQRAWKKVLGENRPLGKSVFVNQSHDNLTEEYGLEDKPDDGAA